jgi:alkanesulfonate monooxygenase SsuD/methylene tetrahydromethanopterin reductase-like flavin-dependent oxidoreductase (luciferase family)
MGLGAGWAKVEYDAYGIPFPEIKTRMDQLEEGLQCLRGLLHDDVSSFEGEWFNLTDARNEPRPIQDKLPIWVGGGGEKRTLKMAARHADGWNVPFIAPDAFAHKNQVLDDHCATVGRDPQQIKRAINVGLAYSDESLEAQFGKLAPMVKPGVLTGTDEEMIDRIGQYVEAGADQVNIALRAPFDLDSIERFAAALHLS